MKLTLITPINKKTIDHVTKVTLPGSVGSFMILRGHAPMISSLLKGVIIYEDQNSSHNIEIDGGFARIQDNEITVILNPIAK